MRWILALVTLIFTVQISSAQVLKVEINPQTLLPNDIADCKLTITVPQSTRISGITIFSPPEIEVSPSSISNIGLLTPNTYYEFPFTIKAKESGIYTLTIYINTLNGTIKQYMVVRVESKLPEIVLDKTVLTLNEVNKVNFVISSPIKISNVIVEPLFDADPKVIYVGDLRGSFKFEPKKEEPLRFKISFYNGRNYHEIVRTVHVQYKRSKGVLINVTPKYSIALIGDVIPIDVNIANLRGDEIYSINISISGGIFSKKRVEIPIVKSGESVFTEFEFCSNSSGEKVIKVEVSYSDEFNNIYYAEKDVKIKILNETTVQLSGIELKPNLGGITLSGDVCNNGRSKIYNILVTAIANGQTKTYYIDTLDPSDFESFDFTFANATSIALKVKWTNEIGETFEISKVVKAPLIAKKNIYGTNYFPLLVSVLVLALVVAFVVVILKRRK